MPPTVPPFLYYFIAEHYFVVGSIFPQYVSNDNVQIERGAVEGTNYIKVFCI